MAESSNGHYLRNASSSVALFVEVFVCQKIKKLQDANLSFSMKIGKGNSLVVTFRNGLCKSRYTNISELHSLKNSNQGEFTSARGFLSS